MLCPRDELVEGRRLAFFDGPGGTQCPDEVIDAISRYLREDNANIGAPYETSIRTTELVDVAHERAGTFLGCSPGETAFGQSMTALNFLLSRAFGRTLREADEIVVTALDHDASVSPWLELARERTGKEEVESGHALPERHLAGIAAQENTRTLVRCVDHRVRPARGLVGRADVRVVLAQIAGDRVDHLVGALRPARTVEESEPAVEGAEARADGRDVENGAWLQTRPSPLAGAAALTRPSTRRQAPPSETRR